MSAGQPQLPRYIVGCVARATGRDRAVSGAVGGALSPSQVNRLTARGFDLPVEGWAALVPMVGTGRDLDVAAIRLAAEHGYSTTALRRVLAEPDVRRAETILVAISGAQLDAAGTIARRVDRLSEPVEEYARIMVGSSYLEAEDVLKGQPVEFADSYDLAQQLASDVGPQPEGDHQEDFAMTMRRTGHLAINQWPARWAKKASNEEITAAVEAAHTFGNKVIRRFRLGEEDYWRAVAILAPYIGLALAAVGSMFPLGNAAEKNESRELT